VYFPPGHYCVHPVKVPSQITLLGHSAWACCDRGLAPGYKGRTKLTPLSADARAFLDLDGKVGTRIQGLTLDGLNLGARMHGIYVGNLGVENGVVNEDCRIESFSGSGVRLDLAWVAAVRRCIIAGCGEHGIDLSRSYDIWIMDTLSAPTRRGSVSTPARSGAAPAWTSARRTPPRRVTPSTTARICGPTKRR
jgi:hypothetical protein